MGGDCYAAAAAVSQCVNGAVSRVIWFVGPASGYVDVLLSQCDSTLLSSCRRAWLSSASV
jgi:hypothetical protein